MQKTIDFIQNNPQSHWVGDGFPVRTLFSYHERAERFSPFLLLDYAGPAEFQPSDTRRGVGEHPHRGFETVTIAYAGEVEHRDSSGGGGIIKPGDVQWMTAASGVVHEEMHSHEYTQKGGPFEVVQLWVNLPKSHKMSTPRYQALLNTNIPSIPLNESASARIIAGELNGVRGPAQTFTPINLWDLTILKGQSIVLKTPKEHHTFLLCLKGKVALTDNTPLETAQLAAFKTDGDEIAISTQEDSLLLLMSGTPIEEPIFGYGPFVMNTKEEIVEAFQDYQSGKMGHLSE